MTSSTSAYRELEHVVLKSDVPEACPRVGDVGAVSTDGCMAQSPLSALRERRRQRLFAAYAEAALDPVFVASMQETAQAFDVAASDGLISRE